MSNIQRMEALSKVSKRKYKCPYCDNRYDRVRMITHIEKKHPEYISEEFTATRIVFNLVNKKEKGTCVMCGKEAQWNEQKGRYDRFCSKECIKTYTQLADKRLKDVTGKTKQELLKDPEYQNKVMLSHRSIAGTYTFQDGTKRKYVGSYEKNFLNFMDVFLNVKAEDLETPGPIIDYTYKGKKHKWITDAYYAPYNLVFDIKDGGDNPNNREMPEYREKQVAKEEAIKKLNKYNYIRLTDNKFEQLLQLMIELKELYIENNGAYNPIIRINESYIINEIDNSEDNEMIGEGYLLNKKDIYYNKDKFDSGEINLCFITGHSGSGKTTMGRYMQSEKNVETYELDDLIFNYNFSDDNLKEYGDLIYSFFKGVGKQFRYHSKKELYDDHKWDDTSDYNGYEFSIITSFVNYAIKYVKSHKNTKFVLEGVWIYMFFEPKYFEDYAVYIKGTSALISNLRASKRDSSDGKDKLEIFKNRIKLSIKNLKNYLLNEKDVSKFYNYFKSKMDKGINESYMKSNIDKDFKSKGKLSLSSFKKVNFDKSIVDEYKSEVKLLRHADPKDKGYAWIDKDDNLVAYCTVDDSKSKDDHIWITAIEVYKQYQGYGLSKQLLDVAVKELKGDALSVAVDNKVAKNIYDKYGFKTSKESEYEVKNGYRKMYFMYLNESSLNETKAKDLGPKMCKKCGSKKIGVFFKGEPIYQCKDCGTFLGVVPFKHESVLLDSASTLDPNHKTKSTNKLFRYIDIKNKEADKYLKQDKYCIKHWDYIHNDNIGEIVIDEDEDKLAGYIFIDNKKYPGFIVPLFVIKRYRGYGLSSKLLKDAVTKYKAIDLCVDKDNEIAIRLYKNNGFVIIGDGNNKNQYWMKLKSKLTKSEKENIKINESSLNEACKDIETARKFVRDVGKLAKKYNANYFIVTDGASGTSNTGNPAVKHARDCHIEWEKKHGHDPYEDWSKDKKIDESYLNEVKAKDMGPKVCNKCGSKNIGVFFKGEPIYQCKDCGTFLGVVPFKHESTVVELSLDDNIDTIIFDFGDVLLRPDSDYIFMNYKFIPNEYKKKALKLLHKDYDLYSLVDILNYIDEEIPELSNHKDELIDLYSQIYPYDYTYDLLKTLKNRGYKLYYLSNWSKWGIEILKMQNRLSLLDLFDGGIFSYEVKMRKPDLEIYRYLIDKYNINPSKAVFFDDKEENIEAAKEVGLNGYVFNYENYDYILQTYTGLSEPNNALEGSVLNNRGSYILLYEYVDPNTIDYLDDDNTYPTIDMCIRLEHHYGKDMYCYSFDRNTYVTEYVGKMHISESNNNEYSVTWMEGPNSIDSISEAAINEDYTNFVNEEAIYDSKHKNPIYVVLMAGNSLLSYAIRGVTKSDYTHCAISFDSSLKPFYSFGMKECLQLRDMGFAILHPQVQEYRNAKIKFSVYVMFVTDAQKKKMIERLKWFIDKEAFLGYDFIGLIKYIFNRSSDRNLEKWFCSRFVMEVLGQGIKISRDTSLYSPQQVKDELTNISLVNHGNDFYHYDKRITDKNVRDIKNDRYNYDENQ